MKTKVETKGNVVAIIRNKRKAISEYGVRRLGLFGSFLHKTQNPGIDIDILVEFDPDRKTYDNSIQFVGLFHRPEVTPMEREEAKLRVQRAKMPTDT